MNRNESIVSEEFIFGDEITVEDAPGVMPGVPTDFGKTSSSRRGGIGTSTRK